jgi:hypothetical protein
VAASGKPQDADPRDELTPYELNRRAAEDAEDFSLNVAINSGLRAPWPDLDALIGMPFLPGWLVLFGARAKSGKSSLMRGLFQAWTELQRRVLYVGTEQDAFILHLLMAAERLGVSPRIALDPTKPEHFRCLRAVDEWVESPQGKLSAIVSEADLSLGRFTYWCRYAYQHGFSAVLLDHFNRTGGTGVQADRNGVRSDDVRQIKTLAVKSGMTICAAAQLRQGEGGALLGLYEVPGPGSWAETANLRRECDVAVQAWRPFKPGVKPGMKMMARDNPQRLGEIIQRNVMALRVDAHRYNPECEDGAYTRLTVVPGGGLDSYQPSVMDQIIQPATSES